MSTATGTRAPGPAGMRRPRAAMTADAMGTVLSVHVLSRLDAGAGAGAEKGVDAAVSLACAAFLERVRTDQRKFSTFIADSAVSRIRRGEIGIDADAEVAAVAAACARMESRSGGRFSAQWRGGFDPTGYVKGWSVERAATTCLVPLLDADVDAVAVNAGGDVRVFTAERSDWVWNIGIADPFDRGAVLARVGLRDGAVASSGRAERGGHLVDPRSGRTAEAIGASVVAADLAVADAWATVAAVAGCSDLSWIGAAPETTGIVVGDAGRVRRWAAGIEVGGADADALAFIGIGSARPDRS